MDTFDVVLKLWPIAFAICGLCAWVGGLHFMVNSHKDAIARLFDKMDRNQETLTARIDEALKSK